MHRIPLLEVDSKKSPQQGRSQFCTRSVYKVRERSCLAGLEHWREQPRPLSSTNSF